jgi:hypothetical protein
MVTLLSRGHSNPVALVGQYCNDWGSGACLGDVGGVNMC